MWASVSSKVAIELDSILLVQWNERHWICLWKQLTCVGSLLNISQLYFKAFHKVVSLAAVFVSSRNVLPKQTLRNETKTAARETIHRASTSIFYRRGKVVDNYVLLKHTTNWSIKLSIRKSFPLECRHSLRMLVCGRKKHSPLTMVPSKTIFVDN